MSQPNISIGPFVVGEKPLTLQYTYQDANGNPINLTGYTAKFVYRETSGVLVTANATVVLPATDGNVTYTWTGAELTTPGHYRARFWSGNNAQRLASVLIVFDVASSEGPVPSI